MLDGGLLIYSGFILRVGATYFWATAGHCIIELDEYLQNENVHIWGVSLADCFGQKAKSEETVPLHYEPGTAFSCTATTWR